MDWGGILELVGTAVGFYFGGTEGAAIGSQVGKAAGEELEGDDKEESSGLEYANIAAGLYTGSSTGGGGATGSEDGGMYAAAAEYIPEILSATRTSGEAEEEEEGFDWASLMGGVSAGTKAYGQAASQQNPQTAIPPITSRQLSPSALNTSRISTARLGDLIQKGKRIEV